MALMNGYTKVHSFIILFSVLPFGFLIKDFHLKSKVGKGSRTDEWNKDTPSIKILEFLTATLSLTNIFITK